MKNIFITVFVISCVFYANAGNLENARKAKGKIVITCSPNGENGGLIPLKAIAQIKRGTELKLLPGNYDSAIRIDADRVIISGDGSGKKCNVSVTLNGKNCIINNLWLDQITANRDSIVIDSILGNFYSGHMDKGKMNHSLYNTGIGTINVGYRDTKIELKNCTVASSYDSLDCGQFSKWTITNCILYSNRAVFAFDGYGNKKCKLALRDNLIFGKSSLGSKRYTNSKSEISQASTLKDLKRMCSATLLGKNIIERPIFVKSPNDLGARIIPIGGIRGVTFSSSSYYVQPKNFQLTPESPGQGKGIVLAENSFFQKAQKKEITPKRKREERPTDKKILTPAEKKKKDSWDEEWKKISEEAKKKRDSLNDKEENIDKEPGFGDAPEQPE